MLRLVASFALLAFGALTAAAAEDAPVGQVKKASGEVVLVRGEERLAAKPGDPVHAKDVIETGDDGAIGITLIDNTVLSAGPNSQIALEEYSFDSNDFTGAMTAEVRKGTLAVMSGDIARSSPSAMKVRTPTGTLGVRGTHFAVKVR